MRTDLAEEFNVVEGEQPVGVVDDDGFSVAKLDEPFHLFFETVTVVLNGFRGHHGAHVGAAGRVANIAGAAAQQDNGAVAGHLQTLHEAERHEVTDVKGICGRVEADIETCTAIVNQLADFGFICDLRNEAALLQFFVDLHVCSSFPVSSGSPVRKKPLSQTGQRTNCSWYHLWFGQKAPPGSCNGHTRHRLLGLGRSE